MEQKNLKLYRKRRNENKCNIQKIEVICILFLLFIILELTNFYKKIHFQSTFDSKGTENLITIYVDDIKENTFPSKDSGKLYEKLECSDSGVGAWDDVSWSLTINEIDRSTNCNIYFVSKTSTLLNDRIIADNGGIAEITNKAFVDYTTSAVSKEIYNKLSETDTVIIDNIEYGLKKYYSVSNGLFATRTLTYLPDDNYGLFQTINDNDGVSYYFRGVIDNNFVFFAGFYWRIIRINGDGSIRLIYNGIGPDQTGNSTQLDTNSKFNSNAGDNTYVGYKYGKTSQSTFMNAHSGANDSDIKKILDTWYAENIANKGKDILDKIEKNAIFCGDRNLRKGFVGYSTHSTNYGAWSRISLERKPTLQCKNRSTASGQSKNVPETHDQYTVLGSDRGNKQLKYPIGLITADEISVAGGAGSNTKYRNGVFWLYTGKTYWTMTPNMFDGTSASVYALNAEGYLYHPYVNRSFGVRPVINLKASVTITEGNGKATSPYVIS